MKKYVGDLIKKSRENQKMTVEELAHQIGISVRYLQKIENEGNIPSYVKIKQIVNILSMDANQLFYENYMLDNDDLNRLLFKERLLSKSELNIIEVLVDAFLNSKN